MSDERDPPVYDHWPFPTGCILALALSCILWLGIITAAPYVVGIGSWAVSLALNIVGAK